MNELNRKIVKFLKEYGVGEEVCTKCHHSKDSHFYRLWHPAGYELAKCDECDCEMPRKYKFVPDATATQQLLSTITEQVRLGSSRDGRGQAPTTPKTGYTKPDGTTLEQGYGLFSKEAQTNATAFLIHHRAADVIVMHEETKMPVRAEYHFMDFSAESEPQSSPTTSTTLLEGEE